MYIVSENEMCTKLLREIYMKGVLGGKREKIS